MTITNTERLQKTSWGRATTVSFFTWLLCAAIFVCAPLFVYYFLNAAFFYDCALLAPLSHIFKDEPLRYFTPSFSSTAVVILCVWFCLQVILALSPDTLAKIIPRYRGGLIAGAITPAGHQPAYRINGLQAWVISHALFALGVWQAWFPATILYDHWLDFFWIANAVGFSLAFMAYLKAYLAPTYPEDRRFTKSSFYDFFMGIELHPRIGLFDIKLFFNGRPGIIAWTLINLSFAAAQYTQYGKVTNSMWILNLLQGLYVLYFFWKEAWYLKTIDIHHDHFGWMLAWGDCVWLPYMYTLQGLFLVFHPVELSTAEAAGILVLGLGGFWVFATANNQKDAFKQNPNNLTIWGKEIEIIHCSYTTHDGAVRHSSLLLSGWWGIARHANYTGDLLLSLAYSLTCGVTFLFPYFYFIFLSALLIHRTWRDEQRCSKKYGSAWQEYCRKVPYRLIPRVW